MSNRAYDSDKQEWTPIEHESDDEEWTPNEPESDDEEWTPIELEPLVELESDDKGWIPIEPIANDLITFDTTIKIGEIISEPIEECKEPDDLFLPENKQSYYKRNIVVCIILLFFRCLIVNMISNIISHGIDFGLYTIILCSMGFWAYKLMIGPTYHEYIEPIYFKTRVVNVAKDLANNVFSVAFGRKTIGEIIRDHLTRILLDIVKEIIVNT